MLERMQGELAGADAFGGRLDSMTAIALAESRRAEGSAEPDAWRAAIERRGPCRQRLDDGLCALPPRRVDARVAGARAGTPRRRSPRPTLPRIVLVPLPFVTGSKDSLAGHGCGCRNPQRSAPWQRPMTATRRRTPKPSAATVALDRLGLTRRELEVLPLVAAGHTNKRIAELLFISENTAGVHVSNILGKLGVATRTEAAAIAARLGL